MTENTPVPNATQFRMWLHAVLEILEIRASPFAERAGAPINSARKFLKGDQADLTLDTASLLFTYAQRLAVQEGKVLPEFGPLSGALGAANE